MADEKEPKAETKGESKKPGAEAAEGASPGSEHGGLGEFLFQFLKANPDIAREMSTRMNAVINGQKLQRLKGAAPGAAPPPGGAPGAPMSAPPPQMGMGGPPQQAAPNVPPVGQPTPQQMLANMKAPQG